MCLAAVGVQNARAVDWHWELAPDRYKKMNTFERAQYDKAAKLLETKQAVAAASEFEKFKVQFGESPVLSYAVFMRGYCLHAANQRNAAIKAYQEVVDYFADQTEDAAAALYFEGVANFENGEDSKGVRCMEQLISSPTLNKSPLVGGALRRVADVHWNKKEYDKAVAYWRQTAKQFRHLNDTEFTSALNNLAAWYILTKDYAGYDSVAVDDDASREEANRRRDAAEFMYRRAYQFYIGGFERKAPITEKDLVLEEKALYDYIASTKQWWVKANDAFGYYSRVLGTLALFHKDKVERSKQLNEALAWERDQKDKTIANQQISQFCDLMRQGKQYEDARICQAALTDRVLAAWKEHEVLCDEAKWKEALVVMEQVEASTSADWAARAMNERARIYKDALHEYEKAITLYQRVNNPPASLWQIQDAYHRWQKIDKALTTLTELENLFPDEAARAIWQKAVYYKEMGDKKRAMAQAHRLMKNYPKAPEVSSAHLMCVAYGEPNFGGQTDDDAK